MLTPLIDQYEKELQILEESTKVLPKEILQVFLVRDHIQKLLNDKTDVSADILLDLFKLDSRLKKQANKINQIAQLDTWRNSLEIPVNHWWWFFKQEIHPFDKLDWLCNTLTVASFTASLSLVVDISTRFLGGGIGFWSVLGTISPSVLTLFAAGGILTETGKIVIEKLLFKLRIPTYLIAESKLLISGILCLGLGLCKIYLLPSIAKEHTLNGLQNYKNKNWDKSISDYEKAISLDPENAQAHYLLGFLYEQLQELEKAKSEYKFALKENLPMAYSSLARLYLLEDKPKEAVSLLHVFKDLKPKPANLKDQNEDDILRYNLYHYNLHKNLGWARFQQQRYEEAKGEIEESITYYEKIPYKTTILNRTQEISYRGYKDGASYCLLAQVFERLKEVEKAKEQSCLCRTKGNPRLPEVDKWQFLAGENLNKDENYVCPN